MFEKLLPYLKNKYVIAILAFFIWMMFFDRNNIINQVKLVYTLKGLNQQNEYYMQEMKKDSAELVKLRTDSSSLEKFAREKYLMKKENEDIFLIVKEED
ncbi:MAG: septum formation initiator family protein [Bacteroidales bacterium]|nr:septum formation initiator family protein [Bacteroidales bacterium]